jgi:hypothetical protein
MEHEGAAVDRLADALGVSDVTEAHHGTRPRQRFVGAADEGADAVAALDQPLGDGAPDEPARAGDQHRGIGALFQQRSRHQRCSGRIAARLE